MSYIILYGLYDMRSCNPTPGTFPRIPRIKQINHSFKKCIVRKSGESDCFVRFGLNYRLIQETCDLQSMSEFLNV